MRLDLFFKLMLIFSSLIIFVRLVDVALIRGEYFSVLASENKVRRIPIPAQRGIIYDRNGVYLAQNKEEVRIVRFEKGRAARFVETEGGVEISKNDVIVHYPSRDYPGASTSAHLAGFVGEASKDEVGQKGCSRSIFNLGDSIGRLGVELSYDCELRGRNGEELVEVDTKGGKVRELGRIEPIKGQDLNLAIDIRLQERATRALGGRPGSVVALDPKTGEVLTLVSSPSFDPKEINKNYATLAKDKSLPLFNRAIAGSYPPGSTFKIVSSAAALEEGTIDENFSFTDPGVIKLGEQSFANWLFLKRGGTEGEVNIVKAITRSTDTFFYKIGEMVGIEKIAKWAGKFGLGKKTGIDLFGETAGVVPTPEWKERVRGERWFLGNTYHVSIGQGDVGASPLQIAVATSAIANNGIICKPTVKKIDRERWIMDSCKEIGLSEKTLDLIKQGMVGACSPGGTAWPLFNFSVKYEHSPESTPAKNIQLACKTGTAETGKKDENGKIKTHAWLTGYAPVDDPEIVVTVLVEEGGEGSDVAAPIVKEILEEWFSNKQ